MATIKDVAEASGVTPMTVWSVLSNRPGRVGAQTRARVLQAVRETGYKPRAVKQSAERGQVDTLGLLSGGGYWGLASPGYMHMILDGIISAAAPARQHLTLFETSPFLEDVARSVRTYCDGRCDGLLIMPPFSTHAIVPALQERGFPFVVIGETLSDSDVPVVDVDNVAGASAAVSHLIAQGHVRIAYLRDSDALSAQQREQGYRDALRGGGIALDEDLILHRPWSEGTVTAMVHDLMNRPVRTRPTALFCWNDSVAVRAIETLRNLGLNIPGDVSVAGFDDDPYSAAASPALTTIRQPYLQIGKHAVEMLLQQIEDPATQTRQVLLPGNLIVRDSVSPPTRREAKHGSAA